SGLSGKYAAAWRSAILDPRRCRAPCRCRPSHAGRACVMRVGTGGVRVLRRCQGNRWCQLNVGGKRLRFRRGQALVEFTVFFVLTMVLIAGLVNVGGLLTDHLNVEYAARQGARTAGVLGNQAFADCAIIGAIQNALLNMPNLQLNQIVIYRSDAAGLSQGSSSETIYPGNIICTVTGGVPTLSQ